MDPQVNPGYPYQPPPTAPVSPPRKSRTFLWIALAAGLAFVLLAGVIAFVFTRVSGPTLAGAEEKCNDGPPGTTLADGGKTLIIDGKSESEQLNGQGSGVDTKTEVCILDYLGATAAVISHMDSTRALDGRQTDTWDGFTASWTYHPDNGLDITIQKK